MSHSYTQLKTGYFSGSAYIKDVFSEPEAKETKETAVNVLKAIIKNKDK